MQPERRIKRRVEQPGHRPILPNTIMDCPMDTFHAIPRYQFSTHVQVVMLHGKQIVNTRLHTRSVLLQRLSSFGIIAYRILICGSRAPHG
jgi:hypothetical protein